MIEQGKALAVMGNHELNALAYPTEDAEAPGEYLRRHSPKNEKQHRQTLEQLRPAELAEYLAWFRTLPMWLDLDGLRVVHACWDERAVATVAAALDGRHILTTAFLQSACKKHGALFGPVEVVTKGKEFALPDGVSFLDGDGSVRTEIRMRWYLPPCGQTYRTYALQADEVACDLPLELSVIEHAAPYPTDAKPVFFGHYWLSAPRPEILADNVACLDYGGAKRELLCAYRWQGEPKLTNDHFVWVGANS